MAKKSKSSWVCSACGNVTRGWFGRCNACDAWGTIEEVHAAATPDRAVLHEGAGPAAVADLDPGRRAGQPEEAEGAEPGRDAALLEGDQDRPRAEGRR